MKSNHAKEKYFPLLLFLILCLLSGCGKNSTENGQTSLGLDHGVGSFLFNFDRRSETSALVKDMNQNRLPTSVTWYYEKGGTAREDEGEIKDNSVTSDDPEKISDIYYALSNTIIVGISTDQSKYTHYFVTFDLPDGEQCRFDFVSENSIRLNEQNYVIETDGTLWKSLAE